MAGQFDRDENNTNYWTLTPDSALYVWVGNNIGSANHFSPSDTLGVRPSLNLKSNVIITSGDGTKYNPFTVELGS